MNTLYITFCGHAELYGKESAIYQAILNILSILLKENQNTKFIFLCGGYGGFDLLSAKAIDEIRKNHPKTIIEKLFVTPYITESYRKRNEEMRRTYDEIVYPPIENVPKKYAVVARNRWMVQKADLIIAYVIYEFGGASKTLTYAAKLKKEIIKVEDYM